MASTTKNLGLTKPATSEAYNVSVQNNNMDLIDAKIGAVNGTVKAELDSLSNKIIDRIKCIRMDVELDAQGVWGAWNYNIGYTNYQLLKAFVFTWNNVTVIGANSGFWNIKVDGLASKTVNVCFVIASAIIPNS